MEAGTFLESVFSGIESGYVVLWRGDNKRSTALAHDRLGAANEEVERAKSTRGCNLYYGLGVQGRKLPATERGEEAGVVAIPGAWVDLDLKEASGRKKAKKSYPPADTAWQVIRQLPLSPSVVVNSGGGLHCYWLFNELLEVTEERRGQAKWIVAGWQRLVAERLKAAGGFELDATHDLSRVLRPAGSWNYTHGVAVDVLPDFADPAAWRRYDVADLDQYAMTVEPVAPAATVYAVGALALDQNANPMVERLEALKINCPEFRKVWDHKKDYPSGSERDLALASYCVEALWSDQEIANLLIAHARRFDPERVGKLVERPDYLARTIVKARGDSNRDLALRTLNGAAETREPEPPPPEIPAGPGAAPVSGRQATLGKIGAVLGVAVERWIQFGKEKPLYSLVLAGGREIKIGSASAVLESDKAFRAAIYIETGLVMAHVKGKAWAGVCEALATICEIRDPIDATTIEVLRGQIREYMEKRDVYASHQRDIACASCHTFTDEDDRVHLNLGAFRKYLGRHSQDKWGLVELLNAMRILGFEECHVAYHRDEKRTTRRYWRSPAGYGKDGDSEK